ncbi:hypothetical protein [Nonlabens sp. SY33080]|uniref:hypothetical protein n=1 Tax=Nonlabens sp. SY33080 TaxID=2719911 RepID=UPI001428B87D|nr:hypothetical protein [Nonlabens sp. SY33080]
MKWILSIIASLFLIGACAYYSPEEVEYKVEIGFTSNVTRDFQNAVFEEVAQYLKTTNEDVTLIRSGNSIKIELRGDSQNAEKWRAQVAQVVQNYFTIRLQGYEGSVDVSVAQVLENEIPSSGLGDDVVVFEMKNSLERTPQSVLHAIELEALILSSNYRLTAHTFNNYNSGVSGSFIDQLPDSRAGPIAFV